MSERSELDQIYARYSKSVYRRARQLLGDVEAARDATQEVFLRDARFTQALVAAGIVWLMLIVIELIATGSSSRSTAVPV